MRRRRRIRPRRDERHERAAAGLAHARRIAAACELLGAGADRDAYEALDASELRQLAEAAGDHAPRDFGGARGVLRMLEAGAGA